MLQFFFGDGDTWVRASTKPRPPCVLANALPCFADEIVSIKFEVDVRGDADFGDTKALQPAAVVITPLDTASGAIQKPLDTEFR